jgi:hypothetical protein
MAASNGLCESRSIISCMLFTARRVYARSFGCFVDAADVHCLQDDISCFHFTGASQEEIARAKARLSTFLYPVLRFAAFLNVLLLFYASLNGQNTLLATWNALPPALIERVIASGGRNHFDGYNMFLRFFDVSANQKIPNLALGRQSRYN